ncbi:head completion/stabilization protein [Shewanella dokdonensis]|uniref:Head completion/stabilization protein n=1 Tax=Shewanella dokdonensis TaxID=712036 RepID=A0ABX8DBM5_9GAMM|nr:head completion/stabilization protein [Shewanella dokdonensis]MCL1074820.1 head completion/stabilization protein [Shewanella dokdonensis]QVK22209.1 head completion/stabilization protein [Shewanella dokdonensis]
MSFIATAPASEGTVTNDGFWPEIDLAALQLTMRLDGTVTAERLQHAAINAMILVNRDLAQWQQRQQDNGYASMDAVPARTINGSSERQYLYLRAVYCLTKANLSERYSDYDSTAAKQDDGDNLQSTIDDLRRDAAYAIRDLMDIPHVTVELI